MFLVIILTISMALVAYGWYFKCTDLVAYRGSDGELQYYVCDIQ